MIGRLFRLALLFITLSLLLRWLFNHRQRQTVHDFIRTLAWALIGSSVLFLLLSRFGIRL